MRIMAVIHRGKIGGWCYDIFYKPSLIDRLLKRKPPATAVDYEAPGCLYVQMFQGEGWRYLGSGDTLHTDEVLRSMGLKGEEDLEGLKRWLSKTYGRVVFKVFRG